MREFSDDDDRYFAWAGENPSGFVLNVRRNPSVCYMVLHRAACHTIARSREDGAYTSRGYRKVVASTVGELRHYTRFLRRRGQIGTGLW